MCNECNIKIIDRLSSDDIMVLNVLASKKTFNPQLALSKDTICHNANKMTTFRFNTCIIKLEVLGYVMKALNGKSYKFYITRDGLEFLKFYKQYIADNINDY